MGINELGLNCEIHIYDPTTNEPRDAKRIGRAGGIQCIVGMGWINLYKTKGFLSGFWCCWKINYYQPMVLFVSLPQAGCLQGFDPLEGATWWVSEYLSRLSGKANPFCNP